MPYLAPQRIQCIECDAVVYPMELVTAGQYHYHKNCFQCAHCNRKLSLTNFVTSPSGIPYCKPHYNEILKQRGNFENFAIGRVSTSADTVVATTTTTTTTPASRPVYHEVTVDADNRRIVTSTKPRVLKPINRQISVSAPSIPPSSSSSSSDANHAETPAQKPGSRTSLGRKRSLSASSGELSTPTSPTGVKTNSYSSSSDSTSRPTVEAAVSQLPEVPQQNEGGCDEEHNNNNSNSNDDVNNDVAEWTRL